MYNILDIIFWKANVMRRPNYTDQIRTRIESAEGGSVFVSVDFIDSTEKTTLFFPLAEE